MLARTLVALAAVSLIASSAQAESKIVRYPRVVQAPADPYARFYKNGPKPPWGAPQQCFTEEGYGRYWPCGAGPSSMH